MKANSINRLIFSIFISTALVFSASVLMAESTETLSDDVALSGNVRTDVVSYAGEGGSDWTIYVRPGIRFGTEDRVISYYDFLVPLYSTDKSVLFFNPRYSFDDRDGYEWNFGLGYRHLLFDDKAILGGNVFYDMRRSYTGKKYNQVGVGAEVLTEWVNGRVNGYISLSNPKTISSWKDWYFTNTGLAFSQGKEVPMSGVDYELGAKIPYLSDYVETWVYAGGYNFSGKDAKNMNGFMARLEVIPTDFLKLNYEIRNDNIRDTEHYGEVSVEVPFSIGNLVSGKNPFEGLGSRFGKTRTMEERLNEQVRRDLDLKLEQSDYGRPTCMDSCLPEDTEYCGMIYVNNSNTNPSPDGSLENPYIDIDDAFPVVNDNRCTIYVFAGSSPYSDAGYALNSITANNLSLWGDGYNPYGLASGIYPAISGTLNASGLIVNNLTLMGLEANGGINITNTQANSSITFSHLKIKGDAGSGRTVNMGGSGTYTNFTIDNCVLDGEGARSGFYGGTPLFPGTLTITNNEFKNVGVYDVFGTNAGYGSSLVVFANNYIHDCKGTVSFRGQGGQPLGTVLVYNNVFERINTLAAGGTWAALEINCAANIQVYNNTFDTVHTSDPTVPVIWDEGEAIQIWHIGSGNIYRNNFINTYKGIWFCSDIGYVIPVTWDVSGVRVYENNFFLPTITFSGTNPYGLSVTDTAGNDTTSANWGTLNAQNNYWGHSSGPNINGGGPGTGVRINDIPTPNSLVDFSNWATSPF